MVPTQPKFFTVLGLENAAWCWKQRTPADFDSNHHIPNVVDELSLSDNDSDFVRGWRKASSMPSEVHVELLKTNAIPDPYVGFNEHEVQCM